MYRAGLANRPVLQAREETLKNQTGSSCFIIVAAVIVLVLRALFLLFVLLHSQRVASHSGETLRELLHHPEDKASYICCLCH